MSTKCPHCDLSYDRFRTGLSYQDVFNMLWVASDNPKDWVYKRKGSVLRLFRKIKQELWEQHVDQCANSDQQIDDDWEIGIDEY